jgi:hypothetical protein
MELFEFIFLAFQLFKPCGNEGEEFGDLAALCIWV